MYTQRTFNLKGTEPKKWHLVDAEGKVVGRLATEIATLLKGKHNPAYTSHVDSGDFVVVVNADKVVLTGNKWNNKDYFWHSNHIGGIKKRTATEQLKMHPELIIMEAVKGMLPKTTLGRKQLTKLKVFAGAEHSHKSQNLVEYKTRN